MKVIITQREALEKGIWPEIMTMFGLDEDDTVWESEEFILSEERARKLGLLR